MGTEVMSFKEAKAAELERVKAQLSKPTGARISANEKGTFKIPGIGEVPGPLECVIIHFAARNEFYPGVFSRKSMTPPSCAAASDEGTNDDLVPFEDSPDKQAEECDSCPNNQYGSKGNGKACKNIIQLAVVKPGDDDPASQIMTLNLPPTSIKFFNTYVGQLRELDITLSEVITEIDIADEEYLSFRFKKAEGVMNELVETHFARRGEAAEILTAPPRFASDDEEESPNKPARASKKKRTVKK